LIDYPRYSAGSPKEAEKGRGHFLIFLQHTHQPLSAQDKNAPTNRGSRPVLRGSHVRYKLCKEFITIGFFKESTKHNVKRMPQLSNFLTIQYSPIGIE